MMQRTGTPPRGEALLLQLRQDRAGQTGPIDDLVVVNITNLIFSEGKLKSTLAGLTTGGYWQHAAQVSLTSAMACFIWLIVAA